MLTKVYKEWREVSEEMLKDGFTGSIDCGESAVRKDFSVFADLADVITFEAMKQLEGHYEKTH